MILSKINFHLLGVIFFCLTIYGSANAQLKKGDYHLDVQVTNDHLKGLSGQSNFMTSLDLTYLRMANDRFMFGGDISYSFTNADIFSNSITKISFNDFRASQISRYYFTTSRFAPFVNLEHRFELSTGLEFLRINSLFGYRLRPGIGFDYFIRPNIALEGLITVNALNQGDFLIEDNRLNFDLGLKLFFNGKFSKKTLALPERILKKGNIISSTQLSTMNQFYNQEDESLNFALNIRYFLTDRFNVFGEYAYRTSDDLFRNPLNLSLGGSYYLELSNRWFWNFDFISKVNVSGLAHEILRNSSLLINTLNTSLQYFLGPTKIYVGVGYENRAANYSGELNNISNSFQGFTGIDYFINDFIFLNAELGYSESDFEFFEDSERNLGLDLGFGFIIGKGGEEEEKGIEY